MKSNITITCFIEDLYYYLQRTKQTLSKGFSVIPEDNYFVIIDEHGSIVMRDYDSHTFNPTTYNQKEVFELESNDKNNLIFTFEQLKAMAGK